MRDHIPQSVLFSHFSVTASESKGFTCIENFNAYRSRYIQRYNDYLGVSAQKNINNEKFQEMQFGDIVLVSSDVKKRLIPHSILQIQMDIFEWLNWKWKNENDYTQYNVCIYWNYLLQSYRTHVPNVIRKNCKCNKLLQRLIETKFCLAISRIKRWTNVTLVRLYVSPAWKVVYLLTYLLERNEFLSFCCAKK